MTKKQQLREQKKRKERANKRRHLRHINRSQSSLEIQRPIPTAPEGMLRSSIQKFAFQKRFSEDFDTAMGLFFGEEMRDTRTLTAEEPEIADFQEWYFFDYIRSDGTHLIDLFAQEVGPTLPLEEAQMLHDWLRTNHLRLLEVQEVNPGIGETVQDLLSGEVLHCNDISMSRSLRRWSIVIARSLLTQGQWHFTGSGQALSPLDKDKAVEFTRNLWNDYHQHNPAATFADFYGKHSLELRKFITELNERRQNPLYLTPEGHPMVSATATYRVLNMEKIIDRLDATEEFVYAGESEEKRGTAHYNWLLRGRSSIPESTESYDNALMLRTEWTLGPGHPSYRSLGDVMILWTELELACTSRERLIVGKQLLEEILTGLIVHQRDRFEDIRANIGSTPAAPVASQPKRLDRQSLIVENEMLTREMERWLNTPVFKLNNQTPREAVKTAEGRDEVEELLKLMEYLEEGRQPSKQTAFTVAAVRRELGL